MSMTSGPERGRKHPHSDTSPASESDGRAALPAYPDAETQRYERSTEAALFGRYAAVIRRLRGPDGCPWDRKQTARSLRRFLVEEVFELVAALNRLPWNGDSATDASLGREADEVVDELGDLFLVSLLVSDAVECETGRPLADVFSESLNKLVRRHPHVFGDATATDADSVVRNWQQIKRDVEQRTDESRLAASDGLPPLERAQQVQKIAAEAGFDWQSAQPVVEKLREEIAELEAELARTAALDGVTRDDPGIEKELGDLLFSAVNLCRKLKISPSLALARSTDTFRARYEHVSRRSSETGLSGMADLERFWGEAKAQES